jgi:hypothetical protein
MLARGCLCASAVADVWKHAGLPRTATWLPLPTSSESHAASANDGSANESDHGCGKPEEVRSDQLAHLHLHSWCSRSVHCLLPVRLRLQSM